MKGFVEQPITAWIVMGLSRIKDTIRMQLARLPGGFSRELGTRIMPRNSLVL